MNSHTKPSWRFELQWAVATVALVKVRAELVMAIQLILRRKTEIQIYILSLSKSSPPEF